MIRVRGLITSIKANLLVSRNAFPHKIEQSWESQFNDQNPKYNYLQKLLQQNSIRPYFIEKDIKQLQKQDIFFYMQNKELFQKLSRESKMQLIKNPNANTIMKFHLAIEVNSIKNEQVQSLLLQSFNKSVSTLTTKNIIFCLQMISNFKNVSQNINYYEIQKKLLAQQNPEMFINLVYILSLLEFPLQMIQKQHITQKISMLQKIKVSTILYVLKISQFYEIKLTPFTENRLKECFIEKRKQFTQEQGQYIVQILNYYPQSANALNTQCLNNDSYCSFLQFFLQQQEQEPTKQTKQAKKRQIPKIIPHPIPQNIIKTAQSNQFYSILKHRIALQIQSPQTLINDLKNYYTNSLTCINTIIRFLDRQQKLTQQLEIKLQKSILKQLIKNGQKSLQDYKITDMFKVFGYMSLNNMGTINFWKKCLKFITETIENSQNYKHLSGDEQKKFVVYLFHIFKNKPFPRELEDQIINLTLFSLTYNRWSLKQVLSLTVSLKQNKIADNQLWFGIEQKIKQINIRYTQSHSDQRKALKRIVNNFNTIGKGSYEFWSEINKNLNVKQKQQILNGFKIPSTMAHTYLKV